MFLSSFLQQKRYGYLFISHRNNFWKFPLEWMALAAMLMVSCGVQPCTHADFTLCSMRYWLVLLVTGLFLACSACYWPVPWLFRLLLTCSLLVSLVTGFFHLFRVLETSVLVDLLHVTLKIEFEQPVLLVHSCVYNQPQEREMISFTNNSHLLSQIQMQGYG